MKIRKFFADEELGILVEALGKEDIRDLLRKKGIRRKNIANIAYKASATGVITPEEYQTIATKIQAPKTFPSDAEERLEALLSGVMNSEPKQIITILLRRDSSYYNQLRDDFIRATSRIWAPVYETIESYIIRSLDPIGFVSHPLIIRAFEGDMAISHAITEAGERYGQPFAAFALHLANQLNTSFYQLLGATQSTGDSRGPYNRFRILETLLNGNKRMIDLAKTLNLSAADVKRHLKSLKEMNFVDFDSVNLEEKGWFVNEWVVGKPDDVKPVSKMGILTKKVAEYLYGKRYGDCNEIADYISQGERYKDLEIKDLVSEIGTVLSGLRKQGFTKAKYIGRIELSHVWVIPERRDFISEFSRKLREAIQDGNELKAMKELFEGYLNEPAKFVQDATHGIELYIPVSSGINKKSSEIWKKEIYDYILQKGEVRPKDIILCKNPGVYLSEMIKDGVLVKYRREQGKGVFYRVNPNGWLYKRKKLRSIDMSLSYSLTYLPQGSPFISIALEPMPFTPFLISTKLPLSSSK